MGKHITEIPSSPSTPRSPEEQHALFVSLHEQWGEFSQGEKEAIRTILAVNRVKEPLEKDLQLFAAGLCATLTPDVIKTFTPTDRELFGMLAQELNDLDIKLPPQLVPFLTQANEISPQKT